jgi:hypothetical protein
MALQLTGDRLTLGKLIKRYTQGIFVWVSPPLFKNGDIDMARSQEVIGLPFEVSFAVWWSAIRRSVESTW